VTETLLKAGFTPDIQDKEGNTALHAAACHGDTVVAVALLKAKCNPDIQNKEGNTGLDIAEQNKHGEFSRMIRNNNPFSGNRTETQEGADPWSDVRSASRPRDDDTMSVGSAVSSFSSVSLNPTAHAAQRAQQRGIEEHAIKRAKARGKMSLSIHFNGDEDMNDVRDEITWWGGRLKEEFEKLKVGVVIEKGTTEDRRVQVELHGSENMGPAIKDWLKRMTTLGRSGSRARM
jgi:hypothetical protein